MCEVQLYTLAYDNVPVGTKDQCIDHLTAIQSVQVLSLIQVPKHCIAILCGV